MIGPETSHGQTRLRFHTRDSNLTDVTKKVLEGACVEDYEGREIRRCNEGDHPSGCSLVIITIDPSSSALRR